MGELLLLIGFFLFPVYLVQLIIALVTKWPVESLLKGLVASAAALIVGFCIVSVGVKFSLGEIVIAAVIILVVVFRNKLLALILRWWDLLDNLKAKLGIRGKPEIVSVKYLGTESRPARGSRGRVFLTALTFGLLESLLVAALEGNDTYHRFLVQYEDGEVKSVLCREDNPRYAELMSYVRWEDL